MKKVAFYQIQDGDTGAQVAQGLQGNFEALQQEIEAIPPTHCLFRWTRIAGLSTVKKTITASFQNLI